MNVMTRTRAHILSVLLVLSVLCLRCAPAATLWQVGKADNNTAEFAHAPANYTAYREPAFFIVGVSDTKRDWPYVQPGTIDGGWAPGTPQTYDVLFGLKAVPAGACRLVIDLVDTHGIDPPKLRVTINEKSWEYQTPKGGGDASVFGEPAKGREHVIDVPVPADVLRAGDNRVSITTISGSCVLWDALRFEAPDGTEAVATRSRTVVRSSVRTPAATTRFARSASDVTSANRCWPFRRMLQRVSRLRCSTSMVMVLWSRPSGPAAMGKGSW